MKADVAEVEEEGRFAAATTLDALHAELVRQNLSPGWVRTESPAQPNASRSVFVPAHWRYDLCKAAMDAAARVVDTAMADRRNLVLRNPFEANTTATTNTIVCAYQTILPGELAPSHRHVFHAFRFIIDAAGAYSVVDGERTPMETGDVVLTPGWAWHSHGHDGAAPAYWLDGLDAPLTRRLEGIFFEDHPDRFESDVKLVSSSPYRFTRDEMRRRLDRTSPDPEGYAGARIILAAPTMPTMELSMERLRAGQATRRQRATVNRVFCVAEGAGETSVGAKRFLWQRGDTFVVPTWTKYQHKADRDAELFCVSDEPLMRFSRYYRFEGD